MGTLEEKKLSNEDNDTLHSAVSELSKQTEALLSNYRKPTMPKKPVINSERGVKSFDIIAPSADRKAILTEQGKASVESSDSDSFAAEKQADTEDHNSDEHQSIVVKRRALGSPLLDQDSNDEDIKQADNNEESEVNKAAKLRYRAKVIAPTKNSEAEDSQKEEPEDNSEVDKRSGNNNLEEESAEAENQHKKQDSKSEESKPAASKPPEDNSSISAIADQRRQLDLVQKPNQTAPQPAEKKEENLTVYDTEQYHPVLHDWSKLDRPNYGKWLLVGGLIIIACVAAYFFLVR